MAAAPTQSVWSVVRDILTADIGLTADEVIARVKARCLKFPDAVVRGTVHTVRKKLKKKAVGPAVRPAPAAARQTAAPARKAGPAVSPVVRAVLAADLEMPADAVIAQAKARGVTAPDATIRGLVHNIRSELKKRGGTAPRVAAAAEAPAPAPVVSAATPTPAAPEAAGGLSEVLSNVALVNGVVAVCGGVDVARQVAEAVRACGGTDQFAQYLDLVAGIRAGGAK